MLVLTKSPSNLHIRKRKHEGRQSKQEEKATEATKPSNANADTGEQQKLTLSQSSSLCMECLEVHGSCLPNELETSENHLSIEVCVLPVARFSMDRRYSARATAINNPLRV